MASSADIQAQIDDLNNKISKLSGGLGGAGQRTTYEAQIQRLQPQLAAARQAEDQQRQQQEQQQQEQQRQQEQQQQQQQQQQPQQEPAAPLSQVTSKPFALTGGEAGYFNNIDPNTGLPILKQSVFDSQLDPLKTNILTSYNSNIRDQIVNSGWNSKSDAAQVLRGAAVYGLAKPINAGIMGSPTYQKPDGKAVTDQDFINAAKEAGIDPNKYMTTTSNMGMTSTNVNRDALYKAIDDASKGLYRVTNVIGGSADKNTLQPHASILYKADENGNLNPYINPTTGQPDVKYFDATRLKTESGLETYAPFAALLPAAAGILQANGVLPNIFGSTGAGGGFDPTNGGGYGSVGVSTPGVLESLSNSLGLKDLTSGLTTSGLTGALGTVKNVLGAGASILGALNGTPSGQTGGSGTGGSGGSTTPTFLDSTPEFLNKSRSAAPYSGLKTVNKDAEKEIAPLDIEPAVNSQDPTMSTFKVGGLATGGGDFAQMIKDMTPDERAAQSTFSKICDKPEYLYSSKSKTYVPLKALRQTKVNPLATGGLPHKYAAAAPKGHKPEFITGMTGYYACGKGTGQSDDIAAMLHDGDYVMDAETVSALGDGSSKAGREVLEGFREKIPHKKEGGGNPVPAKIADGEYVFPAAFVTSLGGGDNKRGAEILDGLRTKLRAHKRGAPLDKIPPKAKDPIEYIKTRSK